MSGLGLGCVETRGDFSSRPGFTPVRRFLAGVGRLFRIFGVWAVVADSGALERRFEPKMA